MVLQKENGDERAKLDSGVNKKTKRIVGSDIYRGINNPI